MLRNTIPDIKVQSLTVDSSVSQTISNDIPDIKVQSLTVDSSVSQTISNDDMCGRHVGMVYTQNSM